MEKPLVSKKEFNKEMIRWCGYVEELINDERLYDEYLSFMGNGINYGRPKNTYSYFQIKGITTNQRYKEE